MMVTAWGQGAKAGRRSGNCSAGWTWVPWAPCDRCIQVLGAGDRPGQTADAFRQLMVEWGAQSCVQVIPKLLYLH